MLFACFFVRVQSTGRLSDFLAHSSTSTASLVRRASVLVWVISASLVRRASVLVWVISASLLRTFPSPRLVHLGISSGPGLHGTCSTLRQLHDITPRQPLGASLLRHGSSSGTGSYPHIRSSSCAAATFTRRQLPPGPQADLSLHRAPFFDHSCCELHHTSKPPYNCLTHFILVSLFFLYAYGRHTYARSFSSR